MATTASRHGSLTGFLFWVLFAAVGTYLVWPLKDRPRRGIDLVGGFYITLKVDTDEAIKTDLTETMQDVIRKLNEHDIAEPSSHKIIGNKIELAFKTASEANNAFQALKARKLTLKLSQEGEVVSLTMGEPELIALKERAVQGNVDVLRKRLNSLGVSEIPVSRQGERNIIIELPNVDNPAEAKEMIGKASHLEIKLVEAAGRTEDEVLDKYDGILPEGMMVIQGDTQMGEGGMYYLVPDYTDLTGKDLKNAEDGLGGQHQTDPVVKFQFSTDGGDKFYELTSKARGRQIAIIIDGKVISAPVAKVPLRTSGEIIGNFTQESAHSLATMLRSGAFVAPVSFEEERRIGPSLGAESIQKGIMSCVIGLVLLIAFSLFYYKTSGFLAFLALVYNLLLIIFGMYWIDATLTLPGIAGMVLTVGMAIDASVLIFEKVKETMETGVSFKKAIDVGFSDAMTVILDGNITTFLVGIVLYYFGTGPVQGFAVTLMLGILATLISGLFFLKSLFNAVFALFNVDKISI